MAENLRRDGISPEFQSQCDATMLKLFGMDASGTEFQAPAGWYGRLKREDVSQMKRDFEAQFHTSKMKWPEDQAAYLKTLGWDLTDDKGNALLITKQFARVVEAVAKRIAGHAPNMDQVEVEIFEDSMKRQVDEYLRKKRSNKG